MTPAIAQSMRELEEMWDRHNDVLLVRRDPAASLAMMTADPSVRHIPAMTGASGRDGVERFYAQEFLPHLPADLTMTRDSRTVGRFRLVDEMTVSFRHDRELPWLLPGTGPTGRLARVPAVVIVGTERGRISWQRVHWDFATLLAQLGLPLDGPRQAGPGTAAVS